MVAATVLALVTVAATQSLLMLNRQAAEVRVMNAARAEVLSRIQQVQQSAYTPNASPAVVPAILTPGVTTTSVDLGSTSADLGSIPATETWTVTSMPGGIGTVSVRCNVSYTYMKRSLSYELFTYKASD